MQYLQNYNPFGSAVLSTLAAALPVVTLLYFLALHPTKSNHGSIHKGIEAHKAALIASLVSLFAAILVFKMPVQTAGMAWIYGAMYGMFPIGWIVVSAMFLYTITLITAQSIVVATAACYEDKEEGKLAAGPIFRGVLPHSLLLAALMGILVMLQAYVFTGMIPG